MALTDDLISVWKLEESSGTIEDSYGSNDSTSNSADYQATGKSGYCLDFESSNSDFTDFGDNSNYDGLSGLTISCWVKLESLPPTETYIISKGYDLFELKISSTGVVGAYIGNGSSFDGGAATSDAISTGSWYHIMMTYDNSDNSLHIYINGDDKTLNKSTLSYDLGSNSKNLYMGHRSPHEWNYFDGLIDEVYIWGAAKSSSDASSLYNSGDGYFYPFSTDATIEPTALALTGTLKDSSLQVSSTLQLTALTLSMVRGSPDPTIFKMPSVMEITSSLEDPGHAVKQLPTTQALSTTNPTPQNLIVLVASLKMALAGTIPKPNIRRNFSRNWRSAWGRKHKAGLPSSIRVLR